MKHFIQSLLVVALCVRERYRQRRIRKEAL